MTWGRTPPRVKQYLGSWDPSKDAGRAAAAANGLVRAALAPVLKTPDRKRQSIRDSAKGEDCTVRIIGACNFSPDTTVWSHIPELSGGRGMSMKSVDECGCFSCSACHDVVDGRAPLPPGATRESVMLDWFRGHMRSLVILKQKGLL